MATATADPLDEPPGTSRGSSGFRGVPYHGFTPVTPRASSCRLVRPTIRAPAAPGAGEAHAASRAAGTARSATARHPAVVGSPSMSIRSFTARRTPVPDVSYLVMKVVIPSLCPEAAGRDEPYAVVVVVVGSVVTVAPGGSSNSEDAGEDE